MTVQGSPRASRDAKALLIALQQIHMSSFVIIKDIKCETNRNIFYVSEGLQKNPAIAFSEVEDYFMKIAQFAQPDDR